MNKEMLVNMLDDTIFCNKELSKVNLKLEQENTILKKALELACGIDGDIFKCPCICEIGDDTRCYDCKFNYFIEQAKEIIKNVKNKKN